MSHGRHACTRRTLAGVLFLAAGAAAAQPPVPRPMFTAADAAAVTATVHRYFAAFSAKDYGVFREVFNAPFVTDGRPMGIIPTLDLVIQRYEGIRDPLDKADYAVSKAVEVRLIPLRAESALANLHWQRLKKDGGLLDEGAEVMVLAKVDGQWKITGNLGEDLRQFRAGN
jgi:hypothetical protein